MIKYDTSLHVWTAHEINCLCGYSGKAIVMADPDIRCPECDMEYINLSKAMIVDIEESEVK